MQTRFRTRLSSAAAALFLGVFGCGGRLSSGKGGSGGRLGTEAFGGKGGLDASVGTGGNVLRGGAGGADGGAASSGGSVSDAGKACVADCECDDASICDQVTHRCSWSPVLRYGICHIDCPCTGGTCAGECCVMPDGGVATSFSAACDTSGQPCVSDCQCGGGLVCSVPFEGSRGVCTVGIGTCGWCPCFGGTWVGRCCMLPDGSIAGPGSPACGGGPCKDFCDCKNGFFCYDGGCVAICGGSVCFPTCPGDCPVGSPACTGCTTNTDCCAPGTCVDGGCVP
jgi:hypothetical protein